MQRRMLPNDIAVPQLGAVLAFARQEFPPGAELSAFLDGIYTSPLDGVPVTISKIYPDRTDRT